MKKNFINIALVVLVVVTAISVIREQDAWNAMDMLQADNEELERQVAVLEKDLEEHTELKKEHNEVKEEHSQFEKELEELKEPIAYQDFQEAVQTIEEYKAMQTFGDIKDVLSSGPFMGLASLDREGTCPCSISFGRKNMDWKPNVVLDLKEFRLEKDKVILTYDTVDELEKNYQFVMEKSVGWTDQIEKWRITDIIQQKKEY